MEDTEHTSAHDAEPDMFDGPQPHEIALTLRGELIADAEVRTEVFGRDEHPLPVLCMEFKPLSGFKRTIHAEQVFGEANRSLAERKAATLKKGAHITITTTLHDMRTILPHGQAVDLRT
jgi:hypothetical protein